jgi:subtilisin family serine protease
MQGTSMAAPHVSGVVALMLERNPNLTPSQVRSILATTASKNLVGYTGTWNQFYGYGLVDAPAAIQAAIAAAGPAPSPSPVTPTSVPPTVVPTVPPALGCVSSGAGGGGAATGTVRAYLTILFRTCTGGW